MLNDNKTLRCLIIKMIRGPGWIMGRKGYLKIILDMIRKNPYELRGRGILAKAMEPWIRNELETEILKSSLLGGAVFYVLPLHESISLYIFGCLIAENERLTTKFLFNTLRPGSMFIDIGANMGFYSLIAAKMCGSSGRIIAVEPQPNLAENLKRSAELNGWVCNFDVLMVALSE